MLPYATDAPIYYRPIGTISLIVFNVLILLIFGETNPPMAFVADAPSSHGSPESADQAEAMLNSVEIEETTPGTSQPATVALEPALHGWILQYGTIKPWQWLTSNFIHADWMHLIGNMLFLWPFGLIVEGKVGHFVFLSLYLAVGVVQCAIEQIVMLGVEESGSLGASAAISGMLGIVLVWAPRNELSCLWWRYLVDVPVTVFAGLWLVKEGIGVFVSGLGSMGSSMLHLMGFAVGFVLGMIWVKRDWVDCEGFDLLTVWAGKEGQKREAPAVQAEVDRLLKRQPSPSNVKSGSTPESIRQQVTTLISRGEVVLAERLFDKLKSQDASICWTGPELTAIIRHYLSKKRYDESKPWLQRLIDQFPNHSHSPRITLARIYLHEEKPSYVLGLLGNVDVSQLDDKNQLLVRQLIAAAKQQQADGVIELSD